MAAKRDKRIDSATLFTAQVDFTYAGDLKMFADEEQIGAIEKGMKKRGYLEGSHMANAFNMLRPNDLIWPYVVNVYMKGQSPFPFDLLYWNSDSTRMPAANHAFYLRNCYLENKLAKGEMEIGGREARPAKGEGPDLQSRCAGRPYRAGQIGVPRLEGLRRAGGLRARRIGPYRGRRQSG